MLFIILVLKLLSGLIALKNKLKIVASFLLGSFGLDCIVHLINYLNHYPKPYTGIGFVFFAITTFCYLANGAWLLFCAARQNKTIQQVSLLSLGSILLLVLLSYPILSGAALLTVFYAYYGVMALVSVFHCGRSIAKEPSLNTAIILMLSLGCLVELGLIITFGFPYYWLVTLCNCMFFGATLAACGLIPLYKNLLKP